MLKKKYVITAFVLVVILSQAITACVKTPEPSTPLAQAPANAVSTKTGVLIDASMHTATIQAPDGSTYTFGIGDGTEYEGSKDLGETVSVSYDGEYIAGTVAISIITLDEAD